MMLRRDREPSIGCLTVAALTVAALTCAGINAAANALSRWLLG